MTISDRPPYKTFLSALTSVHGSVADAFMLAHGLVVTMALGTRARNRTDAFAETPSQFLFNLLWRMDGV